MPLPVPPPDLVIFDCDGVLVDSELLSCAALAETLAQSGITLDVADALALFLGRSTRAVVEHYAAQGRALPADFLDQLKARVRTRFEAALQPIDGIAAVLARLAIPSCVASSSDLDRVSFSLAATGLAGHFGDRLYTAQMVTQGKPAPDLFLLAAGRMGVSPSRALVIEDSEAGVQAGKAAGMTVWGFSGGGHYQGRDGHAILRAAGADRVFDRMDAF